ncbi:MAG: efflux RND transporter permease subunit [Candidatus Eisenbacteria sp.]|nr:efflux RND transporter permease subunit [Candidatus Eisenbacteria bacterium]
MIIRAAVNRPVAILMIFAGLVLVGALALQRLPVDLLPAINYPNLTVITNYADTPADDLTRLVTQPLEEVITGLAGVRRVVSRTREGVSAITVQYEWGTDMDFANLHLREAIDRVAYRDDFPETANRPLILRWDPSARPIAILVLGGDDPLAQMTDFARDVIKPALEQIQGISQAEVIGGSEREILVRPDFSKLRLYGITMAHIQRALRIANISFPGGRIRRGPLHLPLRILGEFEDLDAIRQTEIPDAGQGVTIADVAEVLDTTKEPEGATLLGDSEVVSLHLYKEVGANTISATRDVDHILGIVTDEYPDFEYSFVYRDADFVEESFRGLRSSLLYGALLAFLVLFFFLQDWRSPIVVGLAIPVSVFATFAFLNFASVSLNLMSLGGLSLAAGMLVDNAIVVLENINRHLRDRHSRTTGSAASQTSPPAISRGSDPGGEDDSVSAIAVRATQEVASPVIAATLTTVAVFFPVIYVPGIAGEFFRDQALTVTISLLISIFTALLLQPMLSARILGAGAHRPRGIFKLSDVFFRGMAGRYHRALEWVLGHKGRFLVALVVVMVAAGWTGVEMRKTFLPDRNQGDFTVALELPAGTPLEQTEKTAATISSFLAQMDEVDTVYAQVGQTERTLASLKEYTAANTARIRVLLHPSRQSRQRMEAVKQRLRERLEDLAGSTYVFRDEGIGLSEILASGEAPFTLGIVAEKSAEALATANELVPRLRQVDGLADVEMDRVLGNPTIEVSLDREKALRYGLEPDQLARELRARIQGVVATSFNEIEQRIDIAVRLPIDQRRNLPKVLGSPISLPGGRTVPLGSFIIQSEGRPVREIVRRNQRRQITISGDVHGRRLGQVWEDVRAILGTLELPAGVGFVTGGEQEEINSSFRDLGWALLLSVLLVYMILAAQFESFLDPVVISVVLPVGALGALVTLFLAGHSVNIISLIGLIALLGISVNDAIVKVATIRRLRLSGYGGRAAILEASALRFRPILMTTLTTVLAMIPMGIGIGTGEQIQRPLAITIMGGLTIATALTLFLTPVVYEILHRWLDRDYEGTLKAARSTLRAAGAGRGGDSR